MICGIDPGAKGAIALLYGNSQDIFDMPMLGKEVNGAEVGVGILKGVIAALEIPYTLVTPQKWKKHFGLSKEKDHSRLLATRLYPNMADKFIRKKDDGRAEAILIAKYGSEQK